MRIAKNRMVPDQSLPATITATPGVGLFLWGSWLGNVGESDKTDWEEA